MKNYVIRLFIFLFAVAPALAQPIENATIPISVTLNSILRLNVVKGGSIAFKVNTIKQYTDGILNLSLYDTQFTVASSEDFNVTMYTEDIAFTNADMYGTPTVMPLANVGYTLAENGNGGLTNWVLTPVAAAYAVLTQAPVILVNSNAGFGAGGTDQNDFTINWELSTTAVLGVVPGGLGAGKTLLSQSLSAGNYTTNAFIVLSSK